jgi:hypothetical protein
MLLSPLLLPLAVLAASPAIVQAYAAYLHRGGVGEAAPGLGPEGDAASSEQEYAALPAKLLKLVLRLVARDEETARTKLTMASPLSSSAASSNIPTPVATPALNAGSRSHAGALKAALEDTYAVGAVAAQFFEAQGTAVIVRLIEELANGAQENASPAVAVEILASLADVSSLRCGLPTSTEGAPGSTAPSQRIPWGTICTHYDLIGTDHSYLDRLLHPREVIEDDLVLEAARFVSNIVLDPEVAEITASQTCSVPSSLLTVVAEKSQDIALAIAAAAAVCRMCGHPLLRASVLSGGEAVELVARIEATATAFQGLIVEAVRAVAPDAAHRLVLSTTSGSRPGTARSGRPGSRPGTAPRSGGREDDTETVLVSVPALTGSIVSFVPPPSDESPEEFPPGTMTLAAAKVKHAELGCLQRYCSLALEAILEEEPEYAESLLAARFAEYNAAWLEAVDADEDAGRLDLDLTGPDDIGEGGYEMWDDSYGGDYVDEYDF